MISNVDICNLALTKLGHNTIVSLTEETENGRRCNRVFSPCKREVLRAYTWSFATKIEPLAEISGEEIINYKYLYSLPVNCLYVVSVYNENKTEINDYKKLLTPNTNVECIATNTYQAYLEYIVDVGDANLFDSVFVSALVLRLASELANITTGKAELASRFLQEYEYLIAKANRLNSQEKNEEKFENSIYLDARC